MKIYIIVVHELDIAAQENLSKQEKQIFSLK